MSALGDLPTKIVSDIRAGPGRESQREERPLLRARVHRQRDPQGFPSLEAAQEEHELVVTGKYVGGHVDQPVAPCAGQPGRSCLEGRQIPGRCAPRESQGAGQDPAATVSNQAPSPAPGARPPRSP